MLFADAIKTEDYVGFLSKIIERNSLYYMADDVIFFCDNAKIHLTEYVFSNIFNSYSFIFNAPYTPAFNIIEEIFSKWKGFLKNKVPKSFKELLSAIN